MEPTSIPLQPSEAVRQLPLRQLFAVEFFVDASEAEARYNHWQSQGHRNVWLHHVRRAELTDMREHLTVNLPFSQAGGEHLYVMVRLS